VIPSWALWWLWEAAKVATFESLITQLLIRALLDLAAEAVLSPAVFLVELPPRTDMQVAMGWQTHRRASSIAKQEVAVLGPLPPVQMRGKALKLQLAMVEPVNQATLHWMALIGITAVAAEVVSESAPPEQLVSEALAVAVPVEGAQMGYVARRISAAAAVAAVEPPSRVARVVPA
jgi:hypothetical protein